MLHTLLALVAACGCSVGARADDGIKLIGVVRVDPFTVDTSGLTEPCGGGACTQDRFGGWGSAIEWTGEGDRYIVQPDRGPKDGGEEYRCRFVEVTIKIDDEKQQRGSLVVGKTHLLSAGEYGLVGLSNVYDASDPAESLRFDPEGVRLGADGTVYISDEYGPLICGFGMDGKRTCVLPVPKKFQIARPDGKGVEEDKLNKSGRVANRGFEGLAITPDKSTLWAILQSPLIQDGGREGENIRMLRIDIKSGKTAEFVYPLDSVHNGCNEILAVDASRFLVIERDGNEGNKAAYKKIVLIDTAGATDVSGIERLKRHELPDDIKPVRKRVLIDLLEERWGIASPSLPEKFEGLAFGPDRADGSRTLLITTDNDFRDDQAGGVWLFSVPRAAMVFEAVTAGK
jgi:hypothetical protein